MSTSPDLLQLGILQINLNHCSTANDNAKQYMIDNSVDIALLQGAHCGKGDILTSFPKD